MSMVAWTTIPPALSSGYGDFRNTVLALSFRDSRLVTAGGRASVPSQYIHLLLAVIAKGGKRQRPYLGWLCVVIGMSLLTT